MIGAAIIARLRQGPLKSEDFAQVSASRKTLHAQICGLRDSGIEVESVRLGHLASSPVEYHLRGGVCPCCEQELV